VERIKHEFSLTPQKPQARRRYVKKKGKDWEEERLSMAVEYLDIVHRPVLRNGADFAINAQC
jgi:hypothetical protein